MSISDFLLNPTGPKNVLNLFSGLKLKEFSCIDDDGRLIDFVNPKIYQKNKKSPAIAAILSIVPGLGRIYAGRFYDGLYSIINLAISWKASSIAIKNKQKILAPVFSVSFAVLYAAEIYGGWRAAKYYQSPQKNKAND